MDNFDLRKYLKENKLTEQTGNKFVWEFTNNAKQSDNQGLKLISVLNDRFTTPESSLKILASLSSSTTAGGGVKASALDIEEFGIENFTAKALAKNVSPEEAKQVKKSRVDELPKDEQYNISSLANIGPKSRKKSNLGTDGEERGGQKYNITQLSPKRNYIQVGGEWYDIPFFPTDPVNVGDPSKWGKIEQTLSYEEFIQQHPNVKAKGSL